LKSVKILRHYLHCIRTYLKDEAQRILFYLHHFLSVKNTKLFFSNFNGNRCRNNPLFIQKNQYLNFGKPTDYVISDNKSITQDFQKYFNLKNYLEVSTLCDDIFFSMQ